MSFSQILKKYRNQASSESEKGASFEKLMVNFLKTYQVYEQSFERVWRWRDFPFRHEISGKDIGIDLVAKTTDGEYWAIQCKCYQEDAYINKNSLDSFLGPSGKTFTDDSGSKVSFANRLFISTTNNWSSEASFELRNQIIPCTKLSLSDLESAQVDWKKLDQGLFGNQSCLPGKNPLPHQTKALREYDNHYKTYDRGTLVMACGTGKTYTSLLMAEKETQNKGLVIFFAP
ncbi:MAG: DEAD/DEAH box helicase family protein, partial [Deltaproteobacteria bacterium]|nr:DEAD/DEAH box helicase family protein [Deltaproteobacteria bacterium]